VSGQQHGLVLLDSAGNVLRPAKLWCDSEAREEAAALSAALGTTIPPGFSVPKHLWVRNHEPAVFAAARHHLLPHEYVNFSLTGALACEPSDASGTGVFNTPARCFDAAACAWADARLLGPSGDVRGGGPGALLPRLVESPEAAVGRVTARAALAFGIPEGALVAAGGGDNAMAALGVGATGPEQLVCSVGTSGTLFLSTPTAPAADPSGIVAPFCDAAGGFLPLLCTQNCTAPAAEVRAAFGLSHAAAESLAAAAIAARAPDAEPLLFLPYLSGERTPNWPHASGALLGLRPGSLAPGPLYAAAIEGAALALRAGAAALLSGPPPRELLLVGGAAVSPLWRRVLASALHLPVRAAAEPEAAALGAALQAAAALRVSEGDTGVTVRAFAALHAPPAEAGVTMPDEALAEYLDRAFLRFQAAGLALFSSTSD